MNNIKYRPDIDGLRAIAVLLVIIFHVNSSLISGGFIGVDIFFTISGYVITKSIYPQILSKDFSFKDFYVKRIKRILPAFYLVGICSLVAGYFIYTPADFVALADSFRYGCAFIANIYFQRHSGYFAPTSETLPLLHTWSLSIEEQFYFLWPIVLILFSKFLTNRNRIILCIIAFISFVAYSEYLARFDSVSAYYLIQSRCYELLGGAILAILPSMNIKPTHSNSFGWLGLIGLICQAFFLTKSNVFPGFNALIVTFSSCFIIYSGSQNSYVSRFLSNRILVFIGKLSYSLYLWHWPILAFYRYYNLDFNFVDSIICLSISFVLSYLSWKFFESPLRYNKLSKRYIYGFYFILPLALLIFVTKTINKQDGYQHRFDSHSLSIYNTAALTFDEVRFSHQTTDALQPFEPYVIGNQSLKSKNDIHTVIWGDSHGGHIRSFIDEMGKELNFSSLYGGLGGCPPLLGSDLVKYGVPEKPCTQHNNKLAEIIANSNVDVVFLAGRWAMYTETTRAQGEKGSRVYLGDKSDYSENRSNSRRALETGLNNTIEFLINHNITPVLFAQVPSYPYKPSNCLIKKSHYKLEKLNCNLDYNEMLSRQYYSEELIHRLAKKHHELIIINPIDALCDGNECRSNIDAIPLYHDNNHLNDAGARQLYSLMKKENVDNFNEVLNTLKKKIK